MKHDDVKIYASNSITKYILRKISNCSVKSGLNIECVPNGVIAVGHMVNCFGVFDQNGVFVKQSISPLQGLKSGSYIPSPPDITSSYCDYDAVYLGNIDVGFGHHLLEHWNRAYALLDKKYSDMKFVFVNDKHVTTVPHFVTEFARLLGMPAENLVVLDKTTAFKNVYVPEPGFKITDFKSFNVPEFSSKEFADIYAQTANNVKGNGNFDKIYVSRAALTLRKTFGEKNVQKIFEHNGYHIIYPEQLSLEEQISLMKGCKSLAGCAGTALHLAVFMPNGGQVIQIKRNKLPLDNCATQYLITKTKEHDLVFIEASVEKRKTKHYDVHSAQIIGVTEHMKRFFDDNGFKYSPSDLEFDKESWNQYIFAGKKIAAERREKYGKSEFEIWILRSIVKTISSFIPNRMKRKVFRTKMREAWGISS